MSLLWAFMFLPAMVLHEFAHAWAAVLLGDHGPAKVGRTSLNPLRHLGLAGAVLLPLVSLAVSGGAVFVGFAKPVVVRPGRLRDPKRDMALVAAAGPAMNALTGGYAAVASHAVRHTHLLYTGLRWFALASMILCVLNLLPIPPLDGSRVMAALLPDRAYAAFLGSAVVLFPAAAIACLSCSWLLHVNPISVYIEATALSACRVLGGW